LWSGNARRFLRAEPLECCRTALPVNNLAIVFYIEETLTVGSRCPSEGDELQRLWMARETLPGALRFYLS
jgi:hypothetical protein